MDKKGLDMFREEMHPSKYHPDLCLELCPLHKAPVLLDSWALLDPFCRGQKLGLKNEGHLSKYCRGDSARAPPESL